MPVQTVAQEIMVMVLTARGGDPAQIVETLHERRKEFWQIPGVSQAAKTAVAKVADILEDLIRAGELPEPAQVCQDCGAPATLVVHNAGTPIRTVCGDCAGRYTWRSYLYSTPIASPAGA